MGEPDPKALTPRLLRHHFRHFFDEIGTFLRENAEKCPVRVCHFSPFPGRQVAEVPGRFITSGCGCAIELATDEPAVETREKNYGRKGPT